MNPTHSKSAFLYRQVRRALRSGRYAPGQRIDPGRIATEFDTSPTPVRFALYRLVGEGLVDDHARGGLFVPLPTELAMRDLYDWMQRLSQMACDLVAAPPRRNGTTVPASPADDLVKLTWQLFDALALATGHRALYDAIRRCNDRLAPVRRAKQGWFEDGFEELATLYRHWRRRDLHALKPALRDYHERRKRQVPGIVALLNESRDALQ